MVAAPVFVFDSSPLVASCQFAVGGVSVAALVIAGTQVWIPPAVYNEVVTRGGTRPDALEAARLVQAGQLHLADVTHMGEELVDLPYYHLGQGEKEALTAHVAEAQRIVQAVSTRYPQGFVPHTLALLGRLTP